MLASSSVTLLVNSCDGFSDTWPACFKLLRLNAEGLATDGILLVTERKEYDYDGLDVRCSRANREIERYRTSSECLIDALDQLRTPLVLYMQDDYFFERPIDAALVNALVQKMAGDPGIGHIGLTHMGSQGPFTPTDDERLWRIGQRANYRISTMAGLWRVDVLRSYLRPEENNWMFEIYGTRRAWRRKDHLFLTVNRDRPEPVSYIHTGIIKGKWHRAVPALFEKFGIPMDFDRRGFYDAPPPLRRKWNTFRALLSDPARLLKGLCGL